MTDWRNRLADDDPRAFINDIDKLGTYTPGQRESQNVQIGQPMPPWDEFMANLGVLVHGGYGTRGTDEERLSRINPPDRVREIMEAYRNRHIYPPDPMLPGPRE